MSTTQSKTPKHAPKAIQAASKVKAKDNTAAKAKVSNKSQAARAKATGRRIVQAANAAEFEKPFLLTLHNLT